MATVVLVGTLDTKGDEYAFLRERLREHERRRARRRRGRARADRASSPTSRATTSRVRPAPMCASLAAAGDRGAAVTAMGAGAEQIVRGLHSRRPARRHPGARRLRRLVDRGARDARAAGRRAEAARLDRRVRRHATVCRRGRRDDDVLGRRHLRHQPRLGADHEQRGSCDRRDGARCRCRPSTASRSSPRRCSASRRRV